MIKNWDEQYAGLVSKCKGKMAPNDDEAGRKGN